MSRIEVFSGIERRWRWSVEEKHRLVAAAFAPGAVVSEVARCGRFIRTSFTGGGRVFAWSRVDLPKSWCLRIFPIAVRRMCCPIGRRR
jgi:hypothetical protein